MYHKIHNMLIFLIMVSKAICSSPGDNFDIFWEPVCAHPMITRCLDSTRMKSCTKNRRFRLNK